MERFWSKVDKSGDCWMWMASLNESGYGRFRVGESHKQAHRVSLEMSGVPIPDGAIVCHACDTPACVNPSHLWVGTHKDNSQDSINKGRRPFFGEGNPSSKLMAYEVDQIIEEYSHGDTSHRVLGRKYGVSHRTIGLIVAGKTWISRNPHGVHG